MTYEVEATLADLSGYDIDFRNTSMKTMSRDFYWYSPILKSKLEGVIGDFVISPKSESELIEILSICYRRNCPVTVRGAGTGNYGQAMPLSGGCILSLKHLNSVRKVQPGRVVVEPGCLLKDIDEACKEHSQHELRMFSSTWSTATIGGFIAGGSGGIGSCTWGALRDLGNIIRLRVITMEANPRILDIRGKDIPRVSHAYGTNGIITEIEIPTAPAYDWIEVFVTAKDFKFAMELANDVANEDGILIKLASIFEAPIAQEYFPRIQSYLTSDDHLLAFMVAPHAMEALATILENRPAKLIYRSDQNTWPRDPGPIYEYAWNHTTLRAIKVDTDITYLQVRYGGPDHIDKVEKIRATFPKWELLQHLEVMKESGKSIFAGLSLVKFTTEERLDEIIKIHEDLGCMIFNPHRYTLEEGGRQKTDERQLQFKHQCDPKGLLNPGKMIAWEDPNWDYRKMYDYPKLRTSPK